MSNSIIAKEKDELTKEKLSQLQAIQRFIGFNENEKPVTIEQVSILKYQAEKYGLDIFNNEITLVFGKPYIMYHGIKKILADRNIDYYVLFRETTLTTEFAETYCDVFITPAGYSNRMEYLKDMKNNGFEIEEAIKLATSTGYSKIFISTLNKKIQKHALLMVKKQAFKDALNFANLSSHHVEGKEDISSISIDFDEEYKTIEVDTKKQQTTNKQTNIDLQKENHKVYGAMRDLLTKDEDISEGFAKILSEKNEAFDKYLFEKMKLNELPNKEAWKVFYTLRDDKNGKRTKILGKLEGFYNDYAETHAFEEANDVVSNDNDDDIPFDTPSEAEKEIIYAK